jgi:thioredoxin-related protein
MKIISVLVIGFFSMAFSTWQPDFKKAKEIAKEKHQLILLNFSGSDWCVPCIRMRKEIFDDPAFSAMADTELVMVNADFPRMKKNQLAKPIKKQNESLADRYNPEGKFPFTLLLDANGKIIHTWDGLPEKDGPKFAKEIKSICDANK